MANRITINILNINILQKNVQKKRKKIAERLNISWGKKCLIFQLYSFFFFSFGVLFFRNVAFKKRWGPLETEEQVGPGPRGCRCKWHRAHRDCRVSDDTRAGGGCQTSRAVQSMQGTLVSIDNTVLGPRLNLETRDRVDGDGVCRQNAQPTANCCVQTTPLSRSH